MDGPVKMCRATVTALVGEQFLR